jgi:hypothetical protein
MLIRREDLHPSVLGLFHRCFVEEVTLLEAEPLPMKAERGRRFRKTLRRLAPWIAGAGLVGVLSAVGVATFSGDLLAAAGTGFGLAAGGLGASIGIVLGRNPIAGEFLHPELAAGAVRRMELAPLARGYCEAVIALARPELRMDDGDARAILAELNAMFARVWEYETHRQELADHGGSQEIARIEGERDSLSRRLEAAPDPDVREAVQQSLSLCEGRLENARIVQPRLQGIEAQQEVLVQSLAAMAAALGRFCAAERSPEPVQPTEVRSLLERTTAHARAIESAVEEVMSLGRL